MTLPLEKIPCEHIHVYVMDTHHCVSYKPCSNQVSGCVYVHKNVLVSIHICLRTEFIFVFHYEGYFTGYTVSQLFITVV